MQQTSAFSRILITIMAFGFALWFGGTVTCATIAYDLIVPGEEFALKDWYPDDIKSHSVYLFAMTAVYADSGFAAAFLAAVVLAIMWRRELRRRGWMFMAFILVILASPVEFYNIWQDIQLSMAVFWDRAPFTDPAISKYFVDRYTSATWSMFAALAVLAMLTALIYIIWRPLDKPQTEETS